MNKQTVISAEPNQKKTWADVSREIGEIQWDWQGWIARGFFELAVSYSGDGKSAVILHSLGRAYLLGKPWPDGSPFKGKRGNIGWMEAESAEAINIERAKKWGLPLSRIVLPFDNPFLNLKMRLPEHVEAVRKLMNRKDIAVGVVDSLLGASGVRDENRSDFFETGQIFAEIAKDTGKPIIGIHHIGKDFTGRGVNREITVEDVRGHSSIVQLARVVWGIDKPAGPDVKRLRVLKTNISALPKAIGFKIDKKGFIDYCEAPVPAENMSQEEKAEKLILHFLEKEKQLAKTVEKYLQRSHISPKTAERAKKNLGIQSVKEGREWYWATPEQLENGKLQGEVGVDSVHDL